jgi:hypothetical protein
MGRFRLLMDETYQSLATYAKAIRLCLSGASPAPDVGLTDEIAFIHHIHRAQRPIPEEHNWVLQLLLAQRVRSGAAPEGLAAKRTEFARPVTILAGGAAVSCQPVIERFRGSVLRALKGFRGTVIFGGTRAGVAGLAGEVAAEGSSAGRRPPGGRQVARHRWRPHLRVRVPPGAGFGRASGDSGT